MFVPTITDGDSDAIAESLVGGTEGSSMEGAKRSGRFESRLRFSVRERRRVGDGERGERERLRL